MAIFSNQATLSYNGNTTNSNIAYGEILDILTVTKTAVEGVYAPGKLVTYAVTLRNTGSTALNGLTLSDNLGGYEFNGTTVYPLTYQNGSSTLFIDGTPQAAPAVVAGPPLVISGINLPAGSDAVLVYQALANEYANPNLGGEVDNTVTVTGGGLSSPITATETVTAAEAPAVSICKSITPSQVVDNDRVTYTFVLQNSGNQALVAIDNAVITDTFDPILTALAVSFNGVSWTEGVEYSYNEATGLFSTIAGEITVPAATYTQDPISGAYRLVPGLATLVVSGTI